MSTPALHTGTRRRKILWLFFSLVASFSIQYLKARLTGRTYYFFEDERHNRKRAIRIRTTALEMGGVLIKVGQFLSSRVDVLPVEYIEELALLQDEVPGVPFDEIRVAVERELGAPLAVLFADFDVKPLAAASLGQVHRATLPTGQVAAVKVQRPGIQEVVTSDLRNFRLIVGWLNRYSAVRRRVDLPQILVEFEETLMLELDYQREGHHAERVATVFRDDPNVEVPRVYWSHTSGTVITLQYMWGTKVTEFQALELQGISRGATAEILMRAYLRQIIEVGFFHADPHPGNIFVRPGPIVVFLDFGMVGTMSHQTVDNLRRVFLGVIQRNFDEVLNALTRLGFIPSNADRQVLKRVIIWTIDTFIEMSFAELQAVDPGIVLDRLQEVFYTESFRIPANFAFLGRALGTLSGLCTALDPSFQFVTVAEPFARRLITEDGGWRGIARTAAVQARSLAGVGYSLPVLAQGVLQRIDAGELDLRREINEMTRSVERLERAMRRLLFGILTAGCITSGAFVFQRHHTAEAVAALIAGLMFLLVAFAPARRRRPF